MKFHCFSGDVGGNPPEWHEWFGQSLESEVLFVQDTTHVATKFKNLFLKHSIFLPIGMWQVSSSHLQFILRTVSKLEHGLTKSDLDNADRMNFPAFQKLTDERVLKSLRQQPDTDGTEALLIVMRDFVASCLPPKQRVFLCWRSCFFLRIWRTWLIEEGYRLSDNFITSNTYACIELNAHALIKSIRWLRKEGLPDLLVPPDFSSQTCEKFFRATRSLSTTNNTVVNFSMLELLHRLRRIELKVVLASALGQEDYKFPRLERKHAAAETGTHRRCDQGLPSDEEILDAVGSAREEAKNLAALLGMNVDLDDCIPCPIESLTSRNIQEHDLTVEAEEAVDVPQEVDEHERGAPESAQQSAESEPHSRVTDHTTATGERVLLRKSTLCWLHAEGKQRQSSDRRFRVQEGTSGQTSLPTPCLELRRAREVNLGDWCIFEIEGDVLVGNVLGFKYLQLKGRKAKYVNPSAPVPITPPTDEQDIGCLCSLYSVEENGTLKLCEVHDFFSLQYYIITVPPPSITNGRYVLDPFLVHYLNLVPKLDDEKCELCNFFCDRSFIQCCDCNIRSHIICRGNETYNVSNNYKCDDCTPLSALRLDINVPF